MEVKGTYKMSGSVGVGIKILVSGRELDESGSVKYPYSGFSGQEYYVATPGKKLEKINIPQYDPSNQGHVLYIFNPWGNAYKFTSTSPYSKDWEFSIVLELWKSTPLFGFIDWENNLFAYSTGRGEAWSDIKEINYIEGVDFYDQPNYNPYAQMSPIGRGQFVGPGLTDLNIFYMERNGSGDMISQQGNAPFCYFSKNDGFTQTNFVTAQSYTLTTATNTEKFTFSPTVVVQAHAANVFTNQINISPKVYQLSKDVFLTGEIYSLNGSRIIGEVEESDIISGTFSYINYNAFDGLRNSTHAFILKVSAQLGSKIGASFEKWFNNTIETEVLKINLTTGETDVVCNYIVTTEQLPISYFFAGWANIFLPSLWSTGSDVRVKTLVSVNNADADVLSKFMVAVFRDAKNSVLIGDIIYYAAEVIGLQNPREMLTKDYQLKIQKFNINDLSSYEESIIQVEKSYQSDVPTRLQTILGIQYHPSF